MSNRNLLKEALADAKVVKEMAITNAKAALEEAFAPQLKAILEKQISEMDEEDEKEDVKEANHDDKMDDEALEELLRELEEAEDDETVAEAEDKEDEKEEKEDEDKEDEKEEKEDEEEEDEIDFDNMTEESLEEFINSVVDEMIKNGEIEAGHPGMEDEMGAGEEVDLDVDMETPEGEDTMDDMDMGDLDMGAGDDMMMEAKKKMKKAHMEKEKMKKEKEEKEKELEEAKKKHKEDEKEMEKKEKQLKEALNVIQALKGELTEINLLNSKLLYTNKIFKAKNLTESNKIKVLSAFDKAETVKEVKLVYDTLAENLVKVETNKQQTAKELVRESKTFASNTIINPAPTNKKPVVDADPMIERMKKLAGLK